MQDVITPTNVDALFKLLLVIIPLFLSLIIRSHLLGVKAERDIGAVARLANESIDYVENLDRRGDLILPPDTRKGAFKARLASTWLLTELQRAGVSMTEQQASSWVASEYQKRVGDVRSVSALSEAARAGVQMIQDLQSSGLIQLPPDVDRSVYLSGAAADWVVTELAKSGTTITRDEALTWVRAEMLRQLQTLTAPSAEHLGQLAKEAVAFLTRLKSTGQLRLRPGTGAENLDNDLVTAWILVEAAKEGLNVTVDDINQAVNEVLASPDVAISTDTVVQPR